MQSCSFGKRKLLVMLSGGVVPSLTVSYRTCSEAQSGWNRSSFAGFLTAALDPFRDPSVTITPPIEPAATERCLRNGRPISRQNSWVPFTVLVRGGGKSLSLALASQVAPISTRRASAPETEASSPPVHGNFEITRELLTVGLGLDGAPDTFRLW